MKKIFLSLFAFLLTMPIVHAAKDHMVYQGKSGPGKGKHIVFLSGDEEYRGEEGLPMLAKIMSQRHGFNCTVLFSLNDKGEIDPNNQQSLSHPQALDSADAIIMLLRFRKWETQPTSTLMKPATVGSPSLAYAPAPTRLTANSVALENGCWAKAGSVTGGTTSAKPAVV